MMIIYVFWDVNSVNLMGVFLFFLHKSMFSELVFVRKSSRRVAQTSFMIAQVASAVVLTVRPFPGGHPPFRE